MEYCTAEEAVRNIKSGSRVYIHSVAAAPVHLINALVKRHNDLENIEIVHLHTEGDAPYANPDYADTFFTRSLFVGKNVRKAINEGRGDYLPVFLSEVPGMFRRQVLPLDVALLQVSPPDKHGYCSLGTSVDVSRAAFESAELVIAQINRNMPRSLGDGIIHQSRINYLVEKDEQLPVVQIPEPSETELRIGSYVADLIEDGATLQLGIGAIPNAVLKSLSNHKDLGIHTEMFSDGVVELFKKGAITGNKKNTHPGKIVAGFILGSRELYDFIDDNPSVAMLDIQYINDTSVIRRNPKVTAINSAIEVDLTGQVCADSIGTFQYSGVGGQMDFIRGAALSEGGKPIIALPSVTSKGVSRITPYLKQGAGVVSTRAHIHYVITEYGVANLYGKTLGERAKALTQIAHPDHRPELEKATKERFGNL